MPPLQKFQTAAALQEHWRHRATDLFYARDFEKALLANQHVLVIGERSEAPTDSEYLEWRGASLHNVASCYHHLGELDIALCYYDLAKQDFERQRSHVNLRRIAFIEARLALISRGQKPDVQSFLDGGGREQAVRHGAAEEASQAAARAEMEEEPLGGGMRNLLSTVPNALRTWRGPVASADEAAACAS
jgi:hypothetical protein